MRWTGSSPGRCHCFQSSTETYLAGPESSPLAQALSVRRVKPPWKCLPHKANVLSQSTNQVYTLFVLIFAGT